jgi:hypothetical protein
MLPRLCVDVPESIHEIAKDLAVLLGDARVDFVVITLF